MVSWRLASIRTAVVLPAPLGPEAEDRPGPDREITTVQRDGIPEPFDQALGDYRLCHAVNLPAPPDRRAAER